MSGLPKAFLTKRVHLPNAVPELVAMCAGYELAEWRTSQLIRSCMNWLPEFALRYEEYAELTHANAFEKIGAAAAFVYDSDSFLSRGELGELLLHIVIREQFGTIPAISKIYFKDSPSVTVKGFDCVHVRFQDEECELWIGEAKLYKSIKAAVSSVIKELGEHCSHRYLRREFAAITRKIDPAWPHASTLRELLDRDQPLDKVFEQICVPVMLTYDSDAISGHQAITTQFEAAFRSEVEAHHGHFSGQSLPTNVSIRLILIPLKSRTELVIEFDRRLKACQAATS